MHQPSLPEAMGSADLVKELTSDVTLLAQRQLKLAQLELAQELHARKSLLQLWGAAGLAAFAGALLLAVAGACAIGSLLDGRYWAGALIVGGVLLLAAAPAGLAAWRRRSGGPLLARTRAGLAKEIEWAKYRTT